jgi:hypothetical protein
MEVGMKKTLMSSVVIGLLFMSTSGFAREWNCQIHTPEGVFSFTVEEPDVEAAKAASLMLYIENKPPTLDVSNIECD